ncbi:PQQ-binding-like beta-propeller repeat protein [Flavobacterium foetidum]|uniref:hypothetical protein n=1 Tax=Flavobacterium foetidum TaxID=2026681 RepID=UPI001074B0BA|nr:hypothetical protein [Flavobacterium foetidum]KAF2517832.1 hypothetical protein E0W73_01090 [Flavobacterium foetidum]
MNYNVLNTKGSIRDFSVMKDKVLINTLKDIKLDDQILYPKFDEYNFSSFINDKYLFYGNLETMVLYDFNNNIKKELNPEYSYYWDTLENNKVLISFNRRKNNLGKKISDYHWLHLEKNQLEKLLFIEKAQNKIFNRSVIITESEFLIKSLSLNTGKYEWEINLEQEIYNYQADGIQKIIGIYDGVLWLSCSKALWGIDISNGKILYTYTKPTEIMNLSDIKLDFFRGYDGYIDGENKKIVGFEHETYYELDLTDLSLKYWIFTQECNKIAAYAPHIGNKCYTKTHIYFIDNINGKIVIFNRITKNFDWIYTFPPESCTGILNDIQISKNKLYVLDTGGTLHIFEKE